MAGKIRTFLSGLSLLWKAFGIFLLLLGGIASLVVFLSHISVSSDAPLDASKALSTPFIIKNDGSFSIKDIETICFIREAIDEHGTKVTGDVEDTYSPGEGSENFTNEIEVGQQISVFCVDSLARIQPTNADIAILICYRPYYFPSFIPKKQEVFRFMTVKDSNRAFHWVYQKSSEEFKKELSQVVSRCKPNFGAKIPGVNE